MRSSAVLFLTLCSTGINQSGKNKGIAKSHKILQGDRIEHVDYITKQITSKLSNELSWKPETKFAEGLKITVKWYLENITWWEPLIKINNH